MSERKIEHARQDREGSAYRIPAEDIKDFDYECDCAVSAPSDEAIGLWIDIKTKWKRFKYKRQG